MSYFAYPRMAAITAALVASAATAQATTILLPSADPDLTAAGVFASGTSLQITASGTIGLLGADGFVHADGSLAAPLINPAYQYALPGAANYPTVFGGDGVNHFAGGGANYDAAAGLFGPAGALTTDTTNPNAIRLGAIVGTFSATPSRSDFFLIGLGTDVTVPPGDDTLYLLVNDTFNPNDTGSFIVNIDPETAIGEPSIILLSLTSGAAAIALRQRRRFDLPGL